MQTMRVELFLIASLPATEELLDNLTNEYGGYTSVGGDGAYVGDTGEVMLDEVVIATLFIEDTPRNRRDMHDYMVGYREEAEQESVLYVINGNDAIFIKE